MSKTMEQALDDALAATFPASDPPCCMATAIAGAPPGHRSSETEAAAEDGSTASRPRRRPRKARS